MNVLLRSANFTSAKPGDAAPNPVARVTVHDLAHTEPLWREFEASAVATPYQRFDWVAAFADTIGRAEDMRAVAAIAYDPDGRPTILLPLALNRSHGLGLASIAGGKHANYHMPLYAPAALPAIDAAAARRFLTLAAAEIGGLDAFLFANQPLAWQSMPNPFAALGGGTSPSAGYKIELASEAAQRIVRGAAHKNLRRKEKRLAAAGAVSYLKATTEADVDAIIGAFLTHKRDRFRETGIDNPFDQSAVAFLRKASLAGPEGGRPAIELFALQAGDRIVAVIGGVADERRFSDMIISFDGDAEIARSSPGHLLIVEVMRVMARRGLDTFDLGVGEMHYKTIFCDTIEPLNDVCVPMTAKGMVYAGAIGSARAVKRFVKQTPWAWRMVGLARAAVARA